MRDETERFDERADSLVDEHEKLLENLISLRKKHNLTQEMVADRMGVTQPTVAAFERYDANPRLSTIRRYAMAVDARIEHQVIDDCDARSAIDEEFQGIAQRNPVHASWSKPIVIEWRPRMAQHR